MTDIQAICYFVNPGETFESMYVGKKEYFIKDVGFIPNIGSPLGSSIDHFYTTFAYTNKRLIISGIKDMNGWIKYFNRCGEWMDIDDNTVVFAKDF